MAHEPTRRERPGNGHPLNGNNNGHPPYPPYGGGWAGTGSEQIRDILHVIFKRKRLVAALFLAVALPGLIAALLRKPAYVASAKVMISTQRSDPAVQPTDLTRLDTVQLNESLVNSEVHIIGSRDLLEQVVRSLAASGNGSGLPPDSQGKPFGQQVLALARKLNITPIKASNVIQVDYSAPDPMVAARLVNRVIDEYLAYHAAVHGSKGLPRFYDDQRRTLEQQLRRSEEALLAFSDSHGIVSPKSEIESAIRMVGEVGAAIRDVNVGVSGTEERIRAIRDQLAAQPEVVKRSQYLEVNPVITQLTTQLVDRQVDRITLRRKYMEADRHVRDNEAEIDELRSELEAELQERPTIVAHQLYRVNPLREDRLRKLLELESSLRELRARQTTLDEELSRANRRLVTLRQKSIEFERLEYDLRSRRDSYELYVKREQEARISQAMDEQKLVNVDVVQRPALPLPRADAQRASVALSLIAGIVVGIAGAFGREYLSRSLRSESDVGRQLGLPLLASISDAR